MKKTKWFLGTGIVMALLVVVAVFTKQPTQATAAEDAKETYHLEQIGTTDYSQISSQGSMKLLKNSSNTSYTIVTKDGKIATIDNTQTKYADVSCVTSGSYYNVVGAYNDDNQMKLVTVTGKEYANGTGFHERVLFTDNLTTGDFAGSFYTVDGNTAVVYDKAGNKIATYTQQDNKKLLKVVCLENQVAFIYDNAQGTGTSSVDFGTVVSVDRAGTTKIVLTEVFGIGTCNEKVLRTYTPYMGDRSTIYLNGKLEVISNEEGSALVDATSSTNTKPNYNGSGSISASEAPELEDGYVAKSKIIFGRFTLYVGYKFDGQTKSACFSPSGKMIADNIYTRIEDAEMVITRDTTGTKTYVYKLCKLLKSGETLKVEQYVEPGESQTTVANDEVVSATTEIKEKEDGSVAVDIALDDVDGSKEVIEVAAAKGVIPAGAKMNISKIKSGEKYEEVQKAVENIANKAVVFEIDLFNSENVKVQPNGNIQFTLDVPAGFATEKVNVYRVEEDGTLTKMEH